jgi:K(+)-stimulated pyrophosphate-energized sodium pump
MGPASLAGLLAGSLAVGATMSLFMANAGGAWDNAKKYIEKGKLAGEKKGTDTHKAAVVGDMVGDPFKDTSGPSMNILIKLMSIVSLVLAPTLAKMHPTKAAETKTQTIELSVISTDSTKMVSDSANTVTISADAKTLLQALQEDGLAPKDNVNIQVKDGKISVNGKALTEEQNSKYSSFLQKK